MNIGDKLICIKTKKSKNLIKNNTYSVTDIKEIKNNKIIIRVISNNHSNLFLLIDNYNKKYKSWKYSMFNDYFITLKEIRKRKLEKINRIY